MDSNNQRMQRGNKKRSNGVSLVFRATAPNTEIKTVSKAPEVNTVKAVTPTPVHNHVHSTHAHVHSSVHTNHVRPVNTPHTHTHVHHNNPNQKNRPNSSLRTNSPLGVKKPIGNKPLRRHGTGQRSMPRAGHRQDNQKRTEIKPADIIPALAPDSIRVIPLGGVEEIGKNMTAIEFGNDIIVIDIGFQFRDENTPGIDYILPNTKYLEERKDKVRAVIITHGHLDHIGGIPYVMPRIGNPPLYSRNLTTVMIKKRQEEFPHLPPLDIKVVEKDETITIGALKVQFFGVTHTIPDSMGVIVHTPYGAIVHTGDLKLDHDNGIASEAEEKEYEKFKNMNVLMLMADSTNVENPGFSMPEKTVHKNIEEIIRTVEGRLIVATFASLLERILKIVEFAEKYGKKVVVEGRSMKTNIEICKYLGLLKAKKETIIATEEMELYPPNRIVVMATGAQGDEYAAMMRIANKTHKYVKITAKDTILLSSSIVPGNERAVQKLKDNLSRQGAKIIHYRIADVHSSGHANKDEMLWIHKKVNSKFFMPLHGYHYMLRVHGEIAKSRGLKDEDIVIPDNGAVIEIQDGGKKIVRLKEKAPSGIVMVDGFSIGDIQEVVIRDRQMLAEDGIFIVFAVINSQTGKLKRSPDIISRGFVYLRESQELLHETRLVVKRTIENTISKMNPINYEYVKSEVTDEVDKFLFVKTAKKPIVIPVIIGI